MASGELRNRLLVAIIGIPIASALVYFGGWALTLVVAGLAAVAATEFYAMAKARGFQPLVFVGASTAAVFVLLAGVFPSFPDFAQSLVAVVVILTLAGLGFSVFGRWPDGSPMSAVATTLFGATYTGGSLAFAVLLRHLPETAGSFPPPTALDGAMLVVFPVAVTWMGDSAAYFAGRAWGKTKLVPRISPGKTRVGAIAGLIASTLTGVLLAEFFLVTLRYVSIGPIAGGAMGLALGFAGQLGDLSESILKRESGVKDSGTILPGHGGILDRVDGLLYTLPLTYFLLLLVWMTT